MDEALTAAVLADSRPGAMAALVRSFGDLDVAEDLYQEACLRALPRWRADGLPRDPTAWLVRVARNAGLDRVRKDRRVDTTDDDAALEAHAAAARAREGYGEEADQESALAESIDRTEYKDDVLRLLFLCCHPDLRPHEQLALALKVVVGFSVEEIARAFVVTPDTMYRRLSRAKARAAELAPSLDTPDMAERARRLAAVETVIYLLFNEGYAAAHGPEHVRHALCDEAIRLARLLLGLFPGQAELMGLLALCLLQHARSRARLDGEGRLVALDDQDRTRWDRAKIAEGRILVEKALRKGHPGPLQVQAAIAAVHCEAAAAADTDWAEIGRLYAVLETLRPGPVTRLNRAVAVAKLHGASAALAMLDPLADDLRRYRPFHSVRAALLEEAGEVPDAIEALEAALACDPTEQEACYLREKLAGLRGMTDGS